MDSQEQPLDPEGLRQLKSAVEGSQQEPEPQEQAEEEEAQPGFVWDPPAEEADQNPFADFPSQVREDVEGLMWLGYIEDAFEFAGHHFILRTLRGDEELVAATVSKEYIDTIGQAKAWAWANVSVSLTSIDHDPNFCPPLGPDKTAWGHARFKWVTSQWFWPLGDYLFRRYVLLAERQNDAFRALINLVDE